MVEERMVIEGEKVMVIVNEFKYLGIHLTNKNEEMVEIQARIQTANKAYFSVLPIFRNRDINQRLKVMLYKTLIRSIVMYGSETWTLSKKAVEKIDSFERKILRRIYGPVCVQGEWRIRYNNELYSLYGELPLSHVIRIKRLKWAGHLIRMEEHRVPKKVFSGDFGGGRPVGRPRNRWEDGVCQDALQILKIRNWRVAAQDRQVWWSATGEAMTRKRADAP